MSEGSGRWRRLFDAEEDDARETVRLVQDAGRRAVTVPGDLQQEHACQRLIDTAVDQLGGIDILVNNASAISLTRTRDTPMKRFDLMHQVNVRGTFACTRACIPFLEKAANPHVLMLSPPLSLDARWYASHLAYTMSKMGMSLCVLGLAEELRAAGIAVNALWPRTIIATSAIRNLLGGEEAIRGSRTPEIVADAAHAIFVRGSREATGQFFIDDEVLAAAGVTDLERYAVAPGAGLLPDLFL